MATAAKPSVDASTQSDLGRMLFPRECDSNLTTHQWDRVEDRAANSISGSRDRMPNVVVDVG